MVTNQSEYTWDFSLLSKNYPLNMTMTTAPNLAVDSKLIKLNFDGTFHKKNGHLVPYTHDYFPDISGTHREQMWIHQNTLNTLVSSAAEYYKDIEFSSPTMTDDLLLVLPELKDICGDSCNFTFAVNPRDTDSMITLTRANGIIMGGPKTKFEAKFLVRTETDAAPKTVLTFETAI